VQSDHPHRSAFAGSDKPLVCSRHTLIECDRDHPRRGELEHYIHRAFSLKHSAHVCSFMPMLLGLQGRDESICGVTGYRHAAMEELFLERYLDQPVQRAIAAASGAPVSREEVVEVGNLASVRCRAAIHIVTLLPQYLLHRRYSWIVFTATQGVRNILNQLQAPMYELAPARADRVAGLKEDWGRYYDTDPRVMAGYLPNGLRFARALASS
jgi:hypothetical protein